MKGIKFVFFCIILLFACSDDVSEKLFSNSGTDFVRFFLLVDSNNDVLEYPAVNGAIIPKTQYTKKDLKTLKIPVTLSTLKENSIDVNFVTIINNLNGIEIHPQNKLTFAKNKKVDTIYVKFNERWDISKNPKIEFELTEVSDSDIKIGIPNSEIINSKLTINFDELNLTYNVALPNNLNVVGNQNETVSIEVDFPNGFISSEVSNINLFRETSSNFLYELNQEPISTENKITYTFIVNENIKIDELEFKTKLELNQLTNYTISGLKTAAITKEIVVDRDNNINTASQFYNALDPFYRTYGTHWFDNNSDDNCEWNTFFAFTYPVEVDANHPNAILFDDKGNTNPSDDVYHHAFRIGFNSPNAGRTTNPFNLKRWFTNEATDSANSPGFNIPEALEFFPLNGTSTSEGFVKVIENDLQIQGRNGNIYIISISGNGTYKEISPGLIEIDFVLEATNTSLFGGTRRSQYKIYNQSNHPIPNAITQNCDNPIDL